MNAERRVGVGLRCDAGGATGVGHLMRCLALAEELVDRGVPVVLLGDLGAVPWALRQADLRGVRVESAPRTPSTLVDVVDRLGLAAVVLDGYHLDPRTGAALRSVGIRVLAIADGGFGAEQEADAYLDQNLGAVPPPTAVATGAVALCGLDYVLLRDVVRDRRPVGAFPPPAAAAPAILAVFGGTDPYDAAGAVVPLLFSTGRPIRVTAVTTLAATSTALRALSLAPGQQLDVVGPVDDLPAIAARSDLIVSASGTSVWEFLCLGTPLALVCVTANQELGYQAVVEAGLAAPLGTLAALRADPEAARAARSVLARLVDDPDARRALATAGMARVDGLGRSRVADVLLRGLR